MADETMENAVGPGPMCPPADPAPADAPGIPGIPDAEGVGVEVRADTPECPPAEPVGTAAGPFTADVAVVEGAKSAVRTFARRLAGVAGSEVTVPASAEVSFQSVYADGAQWVMSSDLTPGTLYFVAYDGRQRAYFMDAYALVPGGGLCVPRERGHA